MPTAKERISECKITQGRTKSSGFCVIKGYFTTSGPVATPDERQLPEAFNYGWDRMDTDGNRERLGRNFNRIPRRPRAPRTVRCDGDEVGLAGVRRQAVFLRGFSSR
jgi:hypothetical protein